MSAAFGYVDGYVSGQHDVLTWLGGSAPEDRTLAAFDERVQFRASLVCLAHNLGIAAGLCRAWRLGYQRGIDDEFSAWRNTDSNDMWRPGCGKAAP